MHIYDAEESAGEIAQTPRRPFARGQQPSQETKPIITQLRAETSFVSSEEKKEGVLVGGPEKMIQLKLYITQLSTVGAYSSSQAGRCSAVITPLPLTTCMIVFLTPYYFVSTFRCVLFLNCQSGAAHPPPTPTTLRTRLFIITIINNCHLPTTTEQTHCLITMLWRLFRRRARVSLATGPSQLLC